MLPNVYGLYCYSLKTYGLNTSPVVCEHFGRYALRRRGHLFARTFRVADVSSSAMFFSIAKSQPTVSPPMSSDTKIEFSTELLRRLHRIHRQRTDLRGQIDRGPRQIKAGEALIGEANAQLEQARKTLQDAQVACDEKQLQLQSRELRIEELESKLNSAATNREFSTLKEQIAADKQANSVLSDEILEAMERLELLQDDVKQAEAELESQNKAHQERVQEIETKATELKSDLEHVEGELTAAEGEIPGGAKQDYQRLTKAKGEDAFASVDEESCEGCGQTLTTNYIDRLRMSLLIRCPACNAFLYLPEDRRV